MVVGEGIIKDGLSKNKLYPCGICNLMVMANSLLYVRCGK